MKKLLFFFSMLTLLCLSGAVKAQTMVVNCYPPTEEYATGYTDGTNKTSGDMQTVSNGGVRGWMTFDVSSIPDGATINSITLKFYCTSNSNSYVKLTSAGGLNPITASASDLNTAIGNDNPNYYTSTYISGFSSIGWKSFALSDAAKNNLQNNGLSNDYFTIGFYEYETYNGYFLNASGYDDATNIPYIEVNYFYTTEPYIELEPSTTTIFTGLTKTLTATVGNISGTPNITYSSDDENVATVSGNGTTATVTAVAPGTATITATMDYNATIYTATCDITVEAPSYCTPYYSYSTDYIKSFTTTGGEENISNQNTGQGTGGYSNYYDSHYLLAEAGTEISFSVIRGYDDTYNYAIWVDWNHDYVFDTSTEIVAQASSTQDWSGTFTIPANTETGDYYMRVEQVYSYTVNPCVSTSYGEVEDYKLTVFVNAYPKPQNLQIVSFDQTTATITWEAPDDNVVSYSYQYKTEVSEWPETWTSTTSTTAPLSNLTNNTHYFFQVKAIYSDGESDIVSTDFTTLASCPAPNPSIDGTPSAHSANMQWTGSANSYNVRWQVSNTIVEDFESGSLSNGWTLANSTSSNTQVNSDAAYNGSSYGFRFEYSEQNDASLISPVLNGTENGVSISFYYKEYSGDYGDEQFHVGYSSDENATDPDDFTYGDIVTASTSWQQYENTFPAGTKRIAIKYVYTGAWYLFIDDIDITIPNDNWTTENTTNTSYPISNLDPETRYLAQVQSVCGEDLSSWSEGVSFTTDVACHAPTSLAKVGDAEARQVALRWNETWANTSWQIDTGDVDHLISVNDPDDATHDAEWHVSYTLTGLTPNHDYTLRVRSNCGSEGFSQWSNSIDIHTAVACPAPTTLAAGTPGPNEVDLTWTRTGTETAWQICLNGDETHPIDVAESDVTITGTTVAYTLDGLTAETPYTVKVRANCGGIDGQSAWSNEENFTTAASCPTPVLESTGITGITGHTANVAWNGFDENDSYVVNYRTAARTVPVLSENFEDQTSFNSNWNVVNYSSANNNRIGRNTNAAHTDIYGFRFSSYSNSSTYEEHLINTNELSLTNGVIEFYYKKSNTDAESFKVGYSSTDNDVASFTFGENHEATQSWQPFHESIPAGTKYISIQYTTTGCNYYLYIDDIVIGNVEPAGEWQTVNVTAPTTSSTIPGLNPETTYEVYVTGHCTTGDVTTDPSATQTFTTTVACPAPTALTFVSATTNTATVTWTSSLSAWIVAYKAETDNSYTEVNTTDKTFTIPNLDPANNYTVKVKADCSANSDGSSEWSNEISFHTECPDNFPLNYTCGFEGPNTTGSNVLPLCWTRIESQYYPAAIDNVNNAHEGTRYLVFSKTSNYPNEIAALPAIDADLNTVRIAFYGKLSSTSTDGTINVGYVTDLDDATTFTSVQTVTLTTSYEKYTVSFGNVNPETSGYIALQSLYNTATATIYIDDITVEPIPSCVEPSELQFVSSTTTTATLQWIAGGSETAWDIYYSTENVAPTSSTEPLATANTNPAIINIPNPATTYYVWVRAHCSDADQSPWIGGINFTTKCDAISTIPINYGFETSEGFPSGVSSSYAPTTNNLGVCWRNEATYKEGSNSSRLWCTSTSSKKVGSQSLMLPDKGSNGSMNKTMLVFPAMNFTSDNGYKLSFWINRDGSSSTTANPEGFKVYVSNTDTIDANAVLLGHYSRNYGIAYPKIESTSGWYQYEVYIPQATITGTVYIIFEGQSYYGNSTYVDDITIDEAPSCYPVGTLAEATNITATSADLSWTLVDNNQESWRITYATNEGFTENMHAIEVTTHENYTLSGLTPETHYYVAVCASCGVNGYGAGSNVIEFTTPVACDAPTALTLVSSTTNSLTVSWTENGSASVWKVAYKAEGEESFHENTIVTENPYTIEGLTDGTNYTVRVISYCPNNYFSHELTGQFQTEASCPAPENLAVTQYSETARGATISWDGNNENDSYTIEYAEGPLTGLTTLLEEGFEGGSMPTGWTQSGNNWKVGSGSGNNSGVSTAATDDFNVNFYTQSSASPEYLITPAMNMDGITTATLSFNYVNPAWAGGIYSLTVYYRVNGGEWNQLESYTSAQSSWITKTIPLTGMSANYQIGFEASGYDNDYGYGIGLDDITITAEYTPTYTWNTLQSGVTGNSYTITTLDPETQYVVRVKGDCNGTPSPASNTVGFTTLEACGAPTAFTLGTVEAHQASFSWTAGNGNEAWKVYVKKHSVAEYPTEYTSVTTAPSTENPVTINELDAATAYDVKIVPTCDENKFYEVENAFTTKCEAVTIPAEGWTEKFDSYTGVTSGATNNLPICWNYINGTSYTNVAGYPLVYNGSSDSYSGNNHLRFNANKNQDPRDQYAVLPAMHDVNTLRINLYARLYHSSYGGTFTVGVMTDPANADSFVPVGEPITLISTNYTKYTINLNSYNGSGNYIAIKLISSTTTSQAFNIDDITVEPIPSCVEPSELQFVSSTSTTATLQWIAGGTETTWDIYCSTENVAPDNSATPTVSATSDNPATVPNLTASTKYYAWVRAHCSDNDQSEWVGGISFTTACEAIVVDATHHYTENFDSYTGYSTGTSAPTGYPNHTMPTCWRFLNMSTSTSTYPMAFLSTYSGYPVSGKCLFFRSSSSTPLYAILPEFTNDISDLMLTFTYRNENTTTNNGTLVAGYMTDPTNAATFDTVLICDRTTTLTEKEVFFKNAPAGSYIAFKYQGGSGDNYYLAIDNVTVEPAPTCYKPTAAEANNVTSGGATISWTRDTRNADGESYSILDADDNEVFNNITIDQNNHTATLTGLTENTPYTFKVATNCANTAEHVDALTVNFTTLENCPKPTNLTLTSGSETAHGATLTWTPGSTANEHYIVEYHVGGDNNWSTINNINEPTYTFTTLEPETYYEARVSAVCGTYMSDYCVDIVNFTTLEACPAPAGLAADNATQNTVDLTWNATDAQTYNVQYRTAAGINIILSEDFSDGLGDWTMQNCHNSTGVSNNMFRFNWNTNPPQYLISPEINVEEASILKFDYKNESTTYPETFKVGFSSTTNSIDAFTWSDEYSVGDVTWHPYSGTIPVGTKYISIQCTSNNQYFLYIDNIVAGVEIPAGPWQSASTTDNTTSLQLPNLTANTNYEVQVQGVCDNTPGAWSSSVNFTTEAIPEFTVTFVAGNSGSCSTTELTGITVELPTATPLEECANNGWIFAGWSTSELTENTTTAPTTLYEAGSTYTPATDINLYAVYKRTEGEAVAASYNLVTEEPNDWSGEYLMVYTNGNAAFNSSLATLDASSNVIDISNFLNNNSIASNATTDAVKVTIASMTGGYSIHAANGKYIGSKNNTDNQLASENTPILNTISLVEGNADIVSSQEHLRCNDNGNVKRFRYYKSTSYTSQNAIQLYKYTSATPVTYASTPDCSIPVSYNIIVTQVQGATITAPSTAFAGDVIQLSIDPEEGYALNQWQVTASTGPVTVNNNSFEMPAANVNVSATLFNVYTVAAEAVPVDGGTVTGAGSYNENTEVSLTANANDGYDFTGWYNGNEQVSVNNTYTFTVTGNVTLEARFAARHTVTFNSGNGTCTTTSLEGSTIDLSNVVALPSDLCANQGWTFAGWSETNVNETTTAPIMVNTIYSPASDIELHAVYSKTETGAGNDTWTMASSIAVGDVVVIVNETASKELTSIHSNNYGVSTDYTTLPAGTYPLTVEQGNTDNTYAFKNNSNYLALTSDGNNLYQIGTLNNTSSWTVEITNGNAIITNVNFTDRVVRYNSGSPRFACYKGTQQPVQLYKLIPGDVTTYNSNPNCVNSYVITAEANDATYGTVTGTVGENAFVSGAEYVENTVIVLQATASEGYHFVNWTKDNAEVSTNAYFSFTVTEAAAYVANFEINSYAITATATEGGSAEVIGTSPYTHGSAVTLNATANTGYHFVNWTKSGAEVSTDANYTITSVTAADEGEYVANFELTTYTITVETVTGGTLYTNTQGTATMGTTVTLSYDAADHYDFNNWTVTNTTTDQPVVVENDQFTMPAGDVTVSASFTMQGTVATPTFTPGEGTYDVAQSVTLSCTTEGATIHYTTDGTEPTANSPVYNEAVTTGGNGTTTTIKAIAMKSGMQNSPVATATYTIRPLYTVTISEIANGTVTADPTSAVEGTTITLTADPATGYHFASWHVTSGNEVIAVNNNQFIMPAGNVTVNASFETNSYTLTVNYKYADGTTAAATHTESVNYNAAYSVTSPTITGYTPDQIEVSGTMGTADVTVDVTYNVNSYTLTVNYKYADGTEAAATHTEPVNYNATYSVTSPTITGYTPDQIEVSGTMGTADVTVDVTYNVNSYTLTINYKYADGTEAAATHTEPVNYNVAYSVTSPTITGYTPDQIEVSGTMGTADVTVDVTYNVNSYTLTVNYKYSNGTTAAATHTEQVNYNAAYSVTSPTITGYTPDVAEVSGTMGTADMTVDVTYNVNSYTLTINYKYSNGTTAAATHTEPVNYNAAYSVTSPTITGYTPDVAEVSGTMGTADMTVDVTYTINSYTLTINYKYSNGTTAAATHTEPVNYNAAYSVTSPTITGYTPDQAEVSGTMGTADVTIDVTYNVNSYTLTINYKYSNGTIAAATHTEPVNYNAAYSVTSPTITGYTPDVAEVSGTMGTADVTVDVTYTINSYTLTVNYKYSNGTTAAATHTESVDYNAPYSVTSPTIEGYTPDRPSVNGTMPDEDVVEEVTYLTDVHYLTIHYVYADNTTAHADFMQGYEFGSPYSVTTPAIEGYSPSETVVEGTMGSTDVEVTVTYSINSYTLTINYKYSNGTTAAATHTEPVNYNAAYSVTSPTITGYTPDQAEVSGTMGTADVTVDVTYNVNSYTLTINYKYSNGTTAAATHTEPVNYNAAYSVTSPTITGYTPDVAEVSGTMGTADVTVDVTYTINSYTLTVNYKYSNGITAAATHTESVDYNAPYSVTSPAITGYTPDQAEVSGTMGTADVTVDVTYNVNSYAITTGVLPANSGSVTGAGNYNHFANATLTAIANTGYTFTNWTENGNVVTATNPYVFEVTGARELVANFSLNTYAVSASANPAAGGTVTGAGTYNHGATVTMTADPATGYAFVNWTENGVQVSTDASYTFTFTGARTLVANFTPILYTVTFNPGTGSCQTGSLTGSIESSINIDAVTATPEAICGNQDWVFAGWSTASVGETNQAPAFVSGTEYVPTGNITLYAVYTKTEQGEGTWANATSIEVGDRLALVCNTKLKELSGFSGASTNYGTDASYAGSPAGVYPLTVVQGYNGSTYAFKTSDNTYLSWSSGNSLTTRSNIINESSWNVTFASGDATISNAKDNSRKLQYNSSSPRFACYSSTQTAVQLYKYTASSMTVYNSNPVCYVYAVNVDQNIEHGSVVADQTTDIVAGTEITLTPTPATGYHFGSWIVTAGNDPVTVENNKFTMPESNVNVSALFWIDTLTVNVNANPAVGGTVSGAGDYEYGDMVTLNATANTGYTFVNWTENNQEVSADATYEFTFNGEAGTRTFVANFSLNSYEITVSANPTEGGNVNGGNTYNHGATANLTANPATGYHFVNWTKDGDVVSTSANYSFTVAGAGSYVANFELNSYTIAATANPTAGGTVSGAGTYNHFENVTLTATVSNGYDFIGWYRGNDQVATSLEYSFEATEDVTLEARFATRYTVRFSTGSHSTTTIEPIQGSSVNPININALTADPSALCVDQDWVFAGWSAASVDETTQAPAFVSGTEYVPTDNITLYAVYSKTEGVGSSTASIDFTAQGYTNAQAISDVAISNNVNVTFAQGTNHNNAPKYYSNNVQIPAIRCYGGNTFTVTATDAAITNITLTFGSEDGSNYISPDNGDYSNGTWTGNENSVVFTISGTSGNRRIAGMSVTTFGGIVTYNSDPECFVYDVVVNPNEHGTITADPNTGVIAGTPITLTNTPSEGYHFAGWDVTTTTAEPIAVSNNQFIMPESDVNVSATFEPDTFTLTINYMIDGSAEAPATYETRLAYGTDYSVTSPDVTGYTPNMATVTGTMGNGNVVLTVTYNVNSYNLTIHYVAEGTTAPVDYSESYSYGTSYSVTSPAVTGYTPSTATVTGIMGTQDVELTVTYSVNNYTLTILYQYTDGTTAAQTYTDQVNYNETYSVSSPEITGYTASQTNVSGTMPAEDVNVTVTYATDVYTLTIHYVFTDNTQAANDEIRHLAYGTEYSVNSPNIEGYTADQPVVSGTMGDGNIEIFVRYTINSHSLTINYVKEDETQVAESYTATLNYHETYSVTTPRVAGYAAGKSVVSGTMEDGDVSINVIYYLVNTQIVNATNCSGTGTGSLSVTAPVGNFEYSLDGVAFQSATQFATLNAGDYTLYIRPVNEEYNYAGVWTVNSSIAMPVAVVSSNDSVFCLNASIDLDGTGSSTGSEYSYAWVGPNNYSSTAVNPAPFTASNGNMSGTYILTVTSSITNCSTSDSLSVYINHPSNSDYAFTISAFDAVGNIEIDGLNVIPNFLTPNVNHFMENIVTDYSNMVSFSNNAPVDGYSSTGVYPVMWTAEDACGNTATTSITVRITQSECPFIQDIDGNIYLTVKIGTGEGANCWMAENLRTTRFADGRSLTNIYQYNCPEYPNVESNVATFGLLYDWYDAMDSNIVRNRSGVMQGICPSGWHIPSNDEFDALNTHEIQHLRSTDYWLYNAGDNATGFNMRPSGMYKYTNHRYENLLGNAYFWTADDTNTSEARCRMADCNCYMVMELVDMKTNAYSIRCVRNR